MFHVTLDGMIAVYLVGILCALFLAWVAAEIFRKGRENQRRKYFVICGICDTSSKIFPISTSPSAPAAAR